ncbi:MAG: plasmid pRiA4b ORF-3 family protein [Magnetococcus sp. YQC-5]
MPTLKIFSIYTIKITLADVRPPVWRRVLVPVDLTLHDLHDIIQISMGWHDCHLYEFNVGEKTYGTPDPEYQEVKVLSDKRIKLSTIHNRGIRHFTYLYDFGDSWEHKIAIEKTEPAVPDIHYPRCVTGKRRCPPEDIGGSYGYQEFLQAISTPEHPEHDDYIRWIDEPFDPNQFDQQTVEEKLLEWSTHHYKK